MKIDRPISRRHFIASGLGASTAAGFAPMAAIREADCVAGYPRFSALTDHERRLGNSPHLAILGRPHDWSLVREGLHPFSPERIVLIPHDLQCALSRCEVDRIKARTIRRSKKESDGLAERLRALCKTEKAFAS